MIERVILLADESARYVIGGLTLVDRSLRILEECFAPAIAQGTGPEIMVLWGRTGPGALALRPPLLKVEHRTGGVVPPPERGGKTLILRTNAVLGRGVLSRLLRSSAPDLPFAVLGSEAFPAGWDELAGLPGSGRSVDSVWIADSSVVLARVERKLFGSLGKPTDGLVSRLLNRQISQRLSRLLIHIGVTPNQVSVAVLLLTLAGLGVLTEGSYRGFALGMLLYQAASILDGCDGEIARVKFQETRFGALLDTLVDLGGNLLLPMAIGIGLSRQPALAADLRSAYLLEGILTTAGIALALGGLSRFARATRSNSFNDFGSSAVSRWRLPETLRRLLQGFTQLFRRDTYMFWFMLVALLGRPEWILHAMAIGIALHFPVIVWWWWKLTRGPAPLRAPDRP